MQMQKCKATTFFWKEASSLRDDATKICFSLFIENENA